MRRLDWCLDRQAREIVEVTGKRPSTLDRPGTCTGIVRLGERDQVLEIGLTCGLELFPRVGGPDAAQAFDDLRLDRSGVGVVVPVIRGATGLGRDHEAAP